MSRRPNIGAGDKFNSLTIVARDKSGTPKHPRFQVRCDCGREYVVGGSTLGATNCCRVCAKGGPRNKYGADHFTARDRLHHSWVQMRRRCRLGTRHSRYWADRGITVCLEWQESYVAFRAWSLANGYAPGLAIDRLDVDKGYSPDNCEWVTRSVNSKRARAEYRVVRKSRDAFAPSVYLPIEMLFGEV